MGNAEYMGSIDLTACVETPSEVFDRVVEIINKMVASMKILLVVVLTVVSYSSASPARLRRTPQETSNRFFTGNSAIDAGAAGAALGAAAQFFWEPDLEPLQGWKQEWKQGHQQQVSQWPNSSEWSSW